MRKISTGSRTFENDQIQQSSMIPLKGSGYFYRDGTGICGRKKYQLVGKNLGTAFQKSGIPGLEMNISIGNLGFLRQAFL